jgi:hypothetical protein
MTPSPFQSRDWLRAAGALEHVRPLASDRGEAAVWAWVPDPATRVGRHYYHRPRSLLAGVREEPLLGARGPEARRALVRARSVDWGAAAVTVSPYGYRGGPHGGATRARPALGALADQLLAHARDRGATHVLSHYLTEEDDSAWIEALADRGGIPLMLGADAVLDVSWEHMDEYHEWLGRSRRSLRGRAARGEPDVTWSVRTDRGLAPDQRDVPLLLERQAARFDPAGHPPAALLRAVATGDPFPRVLLTAAEPGAPPRSALAAIDRAGVIHPKFFGTAKPRADYFPIVYTRLIAHAIEHGHRRIEYGGGSHRAKLFRGARLRPLLGVLCVFDARLRDRLLPLAGSLSDAKLAYFSALAERWHTDHLPIAVPAALDHDRARTAERWLRAST